MNPSTADTLIKEYSDLGAQIKALQKKRSDIAAMFPNGRTEGAQLAIYKSGGGWANVVSVKELRQYVTQAVLNRCTHRKHRNGSLRIVSKAKPRPGRKS